MSDRGRWRHARELAACYALIAWCTLGEYRIFERLLFEQPINYGFVVANVQGVLTGHPTSKSWQQRFVAPAAVVALDSVTANRLDSLKLFLGLMALAENLLLFELMRRKNAGLPQSLAIVIGFGFTHLLLTYKLEYPWDGVDILLFSGFGYWASRGGSLLALAPWLALGMLNHETVLYIPLFYLLAPLDRASGLAGPKKQAVLALLVGLVLGGGIFFVREHFFVAKLDFPGATLEPVTPLISNHLHVVHNLRQLLFVNWREGRAFISIGFLSLCVGLFTLVAKRIKLSAALWSLCVIATIVAFGYTNETRHYLLLAAFWFAYGLPWAPTHALPQRT